MLGIFLTAACAEVCRIGYVPTDEQILEGLPNPYEDDTIGLRFSLPHADECEWLHNLCLHVALSPTR
jgi:hypothetical protein